MAKTAAARRRAGNGLGPGRLPPKLKGAATWPAVKQAVKAEVSSSLVVAAAHGGSKSTPSPVTASEPTNSAGSTCSSAHLRQRVRNTLRRRPRAGRILELPAWRQRSDPVPVPVGFFRITALSAFSQPAFSMS